MEEDGERERKEKGGGKKERGRGGEEEAGKEGASDDESGVEKRGIDEEQRVLNCTTEIALRACGERERETRKRERSEREGGREEKSA